MRVTEIFFSIQGEGSRAGRPCVFVRFTGCDLRCGYCDTSYAFHGGREMSRQEVLAEVARHPCKLVLLTGGEPTLQKDLPALAGDLLARGYEVTVETHGQRPLDALPAEVVRIADVKTPDSGEGAADLAWSRDVVRRHGLEGRVHLLFSPVWGKVEPRQLAAWLLDSGLEARL